MSEELLPCPFCAEVPTYYQGGYERYVRCEICLTQGPIAYTDQEAVEFWNRRPSPWRDFRKERPADGQRVRLYWQELGFRNEVRECDSLAVYRINEEEPESGPFFDVGRIASDRIYIAWDWVPVMLWQSLPAPPTAAEIEAAMKGEE